MKMFVTVHKAIDDGNQTCVKNRINFRKDAFIYNVLNGFFQMLKVKEEVVELAAKNSKTEADINELLNRVYCHGFSDLTDSSLYAESLKREPKKN
jgi:hypothetical protein